MKKRFVRPEYVNSHATVESRPNHDAQIGGTTYTQNREDGFDVIVRTDSSNTSELRLFVGQTGLNLSGRQARTLQRVLNKHYVNCGVPSIPGSADFSDLT